MSVKNTNRYMSFNATGYVNDLRKELKSATMKIRDLLASKAEEKARKLPFKTNEVKMADGTKTSDSMRQYALFQSITKENVDFFTSSLADSMSMSLAPKGMKADKSAIATSVSVMGNSTRADYVDSHIGIYYEYGTGTKEDTISLNSLSISLGDHNPFRAFGSGLPIVTRGNRKTWSVGQYTRTSKNGTTVTIPSHVRQSKGTKTDGLWTDAGGNVRKSNGKGGLRNPNFVNYIGEDIRAYHWFREAYRETDKEVEAIYRNAIAKVPLSKYIHLRDKIDLRRKKG